LCGGNENYASKGHLSLEKTNAVLLSSHRGTRTKKKTTIESGAISLAGNETETNSIGHGRCVQVFGFVLFSFSFAKRGHLNAQ